MFYYLATLLIFYFPVTILAIQCLQCDQKLNLNSSEVLNTTRPECTKKNELGDTCLAMLSIDFESKIATTSLGNFPDKALTFSNGNKIIVDSITIWFNKNITLQTILSVGIDSAAGTEDINKTYSTMKKLKHEELRTKLRERLYTNLLYVSDLKCSDNQGQTVNCPNGFCQLTRNGISNVDRKCVPQGKIANQFGIIIGSEGMEGADAETTVIYACNKAMCNGAEIDAQVRQVLIDYELWPSSDTISSTSGTNTSPPRTSTMATLHQTTTNFQWVLLLIITSLLKI